MIKYLYAKYNDKVWWYFDILIMVLWSQSCGYCLHQYRSQHHQVFLSYVGLIQILFYIYNRGFTFRAGPFYRFLGIIKMPMEYIGYFLLLIHDLPNYIFSYYDDITLCVSAVQFFGLKGLECSRSHSSSCLLTMQKNPKLLIYWSRMMH